MNEPRTIDNVIDVYRKKLKRLYDAGNLTKAGQALAELAKPIDDGSDCTFLGHVLKNHLCLSPEILGRLKWIIIQFEGGEGQPGENLRAITIDQTAQASVDRKFADFYKDWKTATAGWVTMTDVLHSTRPAEYAHAVVPDYDGDWCGLSSTFECRQLLFYPKPEASVPGGTATLHIHSHGSAKEHRVSNEKPMGLWDWLAETVPEGEPSWLYLGVNFTDVNRYRRNEADRTRPPEGDDEPVRLWVLTAGLAPPELDQLIRVMCLLEWMLEHSFLRHIRDYLTGKDKDLDQLLSSTGRLDAHPGDNSQNVSSYIESLKREWNAANIPEGTLDAIWDALGIAAGEDAIKLRYVRTLFSNSAAAAGDPGKEGGQECLSLFGILFLVAYVVQRISANADQANGVKSRPDFEIDYQSLEQHGGTPLWSTSNRKLGKALVLDLTAALQSLIRRDPSANDRAGNKYSLTSVRAAESFVELVFDFDPLKGKGAGQRSLYENLLRSLAAEVLPTNERAGGTTTKRLAKLVKTMIELLEPSTSQPRDLYPFPIPLRYQVQPKPGDGFQQNQFVVRFGRGGPDMPRQAQEPGLDWLRSRSHNSQNIVVFDGCNSARLRALQEAINRFDGYRAYDCSSEASFPDGAPTDFLCIICHFEEQSRQLFQGCPYVIWYTGNGPNAVPAYLPGWRYPEAVRVAPYFDQETISKLLPKAGVEPLPANPWEKRVAATLDRSRKHHFAEAKQ